MKVRGRWVRWAARLAAAILVACGLLRGWEAYAATAQDPDARANVALVLAVGGPVAVVIVGLVSGWVLAVLVHLLRAEWHRFDSENR